MKSLPVRVVPTNDPAAPYGHYEDGRPITTPISDADRAADLRRRLDLAPGKCPHKKDPDDCFLCGTRPLPIEPIIDRPSVEELLRRATEFFGLDRTIRPKRPAGSKFVSYRQLLGLSHDDLVGWFSTTIKTTTQIGNGQPVLKSSSRVERGIVRLEKKISREQAVIDSMSARAQKLERMPDDRLDAKTRESYKRQSRAEIKKHDTKLAALRVRLDDWPSNKENWAKTTRTVQVEIKFRECLYEKDQEYEAVVALQRPMTANWKQWENVVVRLAIQAGIYQPPVEIARKYRELSQKVKRELEQADDLSENALILKTGGAQIGGRIKSAGWIDEEGGSVRRQLESFNKGAPSRMDRATEQPGEGGFTSELDSGDLNERGDE
jgi:hypothetical protein